MTVTSDVLQGSDWDPTVYHVYIHNLDRYAGGMIGKFADDTKLDCAIVSKEDSHNILRWPGAVDKMGRTLMDDEVNSG